MAFTGLIKFIPDTKTEALVYETGVGETLSEGYRLVRADFSTYVVGHTITYTYSTVAGALTDAIVVSLYA